jgi:hypothetical protein
MKTSRLTAAILLVITGIIHVVLFAKNPDDPAMTGMLVFGIIYGITGLLLFTAKKYPVYMGLIFPIIGLTLALIKFGMPELVSIETLLHLIDIVVAICCAVLIIGFNKAKAAAA